VVTTDDVQGRAAATFAAGDLEVSRVYVVDDGGVYGRGVARSFADAARSAGIQVVGQSRWDRGAKSYTDLFTTIQQADPDAVFMAGAVSSNGLQLVRDKVAVLGDNQQVRLLAADGFAGEPKLARLAEAQGMYVTFPGLSPKAIRLRGGAGSAFLDAYQRAYGADPVDPYALYAVAAVQVVLQAVEESDGTRRGVREAIFTGDGVTVPKSVSVLGADTTIDPASGDVSIKDVTVEVIKRQEETYETVVTVS
jgi:branched-chain amino acid transport system substrate-binding protein